MIQAVQGNPVTLKKDGLKSLLTVYGFNVMLDGKSMTSGEKQTTIFKPWV